MYAITLISVQKHFGGLGSILCQSLRDLWSTKWI